MEDIDEVEVIEIHISHDGKKIWVNDEKECILRINNVKGPTILNDDRGKNKGLQPIGNIEIPEGLKVIHTHTERMFLDRRGLPTIHTSPMRIELKKDMDNVEKKMYLFGYPYTYKDKGVGEFRYSWYSYEEKKGWKYECEEVP